jgi:hypothetical protein
MRHYKLGLISISNHHLLMCLSALFMCVTIFFIIPTDVIAESLKVKVIKACETCRLPAAPEECQSTKVHWDKAATWIPTKDIKIHAVSIPEQSEISLYVDIEVSRAGKMYLPQGHIFRVKYAGPGILRDPPCANSFIGSNITNTNITFPAGYWISVKAGTPIYVHMDVINWSPYEIYPMAQDIYIYYTE